MSQTTADWTDDPAIGEANRELILNERKVHEYMQNELGDSKPEEYGLNGLILKLKLILTEQEPQETTSK